MITKFNTATVSNNSSSGSSNTLIYIVVGAVAVYLGYKYIIKPQMDKQKEKDA